MTKRIALALFCLGTAAALPAEMQLQIGPEIGLGVWKDTLTVPYETYPGFGMWNVYQDNITQSYTMPGFGIVLRTFPDELFPNQLGKSGVVLRTNVSFVTNLTEDGISYRSSDDNFSITRAFFGLGASSAFLFSKRVHLITEFGFGVSMMNTAWIYDTGDLKKLEYNTMGFGLFSDIGFQFNFTKRLYLELGVNALLNFFSSMEGEATLNTTSRRRVDFDDAGRFDFTAVGFYLHIGWRIPIFAQKPVEKTPLAQAQESP